MATWTYWNSTDSTATSNSTNSSMFSQQRTWYEWSSAISSTTADHSPLSVFNNIIESPPQREVWHQWSSGAGTSAATTSDTWYHWAETVPADTVEYNYKYSYYEPEKYDFLKDHYFRMQSMLDREWNKHIAEQLVKDKEEAEETAKALLLDLISEKEFELYKKTSKLLVKGRKYSYILGKAGNVTRLLDRNNKVAQGMCVHLNRADRNSCPDTDNVIALKLHIEQAEKKFLKTANHHNERNLYKPEEDFLKVVNG